MVVMQWGCRRAAAEFLFMNSLRYMTLFSPLELLWGSFVQRSCGDTAFVVFVVIQSSSVKVLPASRVWSGVLLSRVSVVNHYISLSHVWSLGKVLLLLSLGEMSQQGDF